MNLFELAAKITLDSSEYDKGVKDATEKGKGLSKGFSKFASGAKAVGKTIATGFGVAATGVSALATAAVKSYADYEQLVGGVETLFDKSADTIKGYAENAYKTAGLSANEYMEQATSFSASLIQSLGGDTAKAAELANTAITDMADNANRMGTDISSIQNAYQAFAKGNYTLLDNLKLGKLPLLRVNASNCWELPQGQSATKPIFYRKAQRLSENCTSKRMEMERIA